MRIFIAALVLVTPFACAQAGRGVIEQAATALGGADRIRAVKNITMAGYGQYAYMFGGGRVTGDANAPEKYVAANDLRRVYDLEHDRFQQLERRNMLFPFLIAAAHSFAQVNQILDGDIAFDVQGGTAKRQARWIESPLQVDGVHMRRMWRLNNPVTLLRAALDPGTKISEPHTEGGNTVVELTLQQGDHLFAGFSADHLPLFVRWSNPHTNLGEVNFVTWFTAYGSFDGLLLPLAYDTRLDWRNIDFFKLTVDHYEMDSQIANLGAPAEVRNAPEPPSNPVPTITSVPVAKGLWRTDQAGTTIIEFKDHVTLFELDTNVRVAKAIIAHARSLVPGKPVTELIVSHNHFDHAAGLRQAVAEGLTVISRRANESVFRETTSRPAPNYPDDLSMRPQPMKFRPVDERLTLSDETMTLDIYWARNNIHMADAVFAYAPAARVIIEGDIATAAFDYQFWPDSLRDLIDYYKLNPERLSPVHGVVPGKPILTMREVDELVKGGTERARQRCATELEKGNYFAGCPVWSKRY